MTEKQRQVQAMVNIGLSDIEIADVLRTDELIDKGDKNIQILDKEKEKASKQARQCSKKPTVYKFTKRERKADNDKQFLLNNIIDNLLNIVDKQRIEIVNEEREITFIYNDRKFKVVLSAPRK